MISILYAKRAELQDEIKEFEEEIKKARCNLELLEDLIEEAEEEQTVETASNEYAESNGNGSVAIYP